MFMEKMGPNFSELLNEYGSLLLKQYHFFMIKIENSIELITNLNCLVQERIKES